MGVGPEVCSSLGKASGTVETVGRSWSVGAAVAFTACTVASAVSARVPPRARWLPLEYRSWAARSPLRSKVPRK